MNAVEAGQALIELLSRMYSPGDYGRKLYYIEALRSLEGMLPNPNYVPPGLYWNELVRTLGREKLWGPFFTHLLEDRPRWKAEIVAVRAWCMRVVVFFGASPDGTAPLNVALERARIEREIQAAFARDCWLFLGETETTIAAWRRFLESERPNIVHFAGHASRESLAVEDGLFGASYSAAALAELFAVRPGEVDLVVINACSSAAVGEALVGAGVPAVIGTRAPIYDTVAIAFAEAFYGALAAGQALDVAWRAGLQNPSALALPGGPTRDILWCSPTPLVGGLRRLA